MSFIGRSVSAPLRFLAGAALLFPSQAFAAWTVETPLPRNYVRTRAAAGGGFVYQFGGLGDKGICGAADVHFAPVGADGSVGAWAPTTAIPGIGAPLAVSCAGIEYQLSEVMLGWGYQALYSGGRVYLLGGNHRSFGGFEDGSTIRFSSAVLFAPQNPDGSLGSWRRGPDLPDESFFGAAAEANGVLYMTGGRDDVNSGSASRSIHYSRIGADGAPGAWRTAAELLPGGLSLHGVQAWNGRLYVSGGMTYDPFPRDQITDAVFSAAIGPDGETGAWRAEPSLPTGLAAHGLLARGGVLYTVGGQEPVFPTVNVHTASVSPGGDLSDWSDAEPMPVPLFNHAFASANGSLLVAGGSDGQANQSAVYALRDGAAPAAIADLSASPAGPSSLSLTWTAPGNDGAAGAVANGRYELRVSQDPAALESAAPQTWTASFAPGEAQGRTVNDLAPGTLYHVSVRAVDPAGNRAAASNAASAETGALSPPVPLNPVPSVSSLLPATAIAGGAALTLAVDGAGFVPSSRVVFGGAERVTAFVDPTRLTIDLSAADLASAALVPVAVFNPAPGGGTSGARTFTVAEPAPALAALSPASAPAGAPGVTISASGSGFRPGTKARFNGSERPTRVLDSSRLELDLGAADLAAASEASIDAATPGPGGGASAALAFTVRNPAPSIAAISPASADEGSSGLTVTVDGDGFLASSAVRWAGAARATTFVSSSRLTAAIPSSDVAAAGAYAVTVANPAPGGGVSEPATFVVQKPAPPPNPVPSLTSLAPASALAGAAGVALVVRGSGFTDASVVRWNGEDRPTTRVDATRLEAALASADVAAAGVHGVAVFNPAPGGGLSSPLAFHVENPAPAVSSLSPASAVAGGGPVTVLVDGSGFVSGSIVRWNGQARATSFVSASRLAASIPVSDLAAAGAAAVTVANAAPGGGVSSAASFRVDNPAPVLASAVPGSASAGGPAFTLALHGSGFTPSSTARWNGSARTTRFVSAARLDADVTAADIASAGAASLTVVTPSPGGGASASLAFSVVDRPAVLLVSFNPSTLNLKSGGNHVKAKVEDGEADADDIAAESVAITAVDGAAVAPLAASSYKQKKHELEATFDRGEVEARLTAGDRVVTLSGRLKNGRPFKADGVIRAIHASSGQASASSSGQGTAPTAAKKPLPKPRFWPAPAALLAMKISSRGESLPEDVSIKGRGRSVTREGVAVRVPEGAEPAPVPITISMTAADQSVDKDDRKRETEKKRLVEVSAPAVFGPEGTVFAQPVTLELPYDPALLPAGVDESKLAVHYWNPNARQWEKLASTVDRVARIVRAQTSHFSTYQVLAGAAAAGDLSLVDAYAFPNPSRRNERITFRIQPGSANTVHVDAYDVSGRQVFSSNNFTFRPAFDDGNGKGAQDTYDVAWDVTGVGSGVYSYVITARKDNGSKVRKSGKAAVIK